MHLVLAIGFLALSAELPGSEEASLPLPEEEEGSWLGGRSSRSTSSSSWSISCKGPASVMFLEFRVSRTPSIDLFLVVWKRRSSTFSLVS